jgi:hypothetical protein
MAEPVFTIPSNQPLIGIPFEKNGQEVTSYFSEEALTKRALSSARMQKTLNLAGAWRDLNWEAMEKELNLIRHQSTPTPPFDL